MSEKLSSIVRFRGDRLFNGAVNISWYGSDAEKTKAASEAFVFHGPKYHGVQQADVGSTHEHKLIDTATLALSIIRRCYGFEAQPFTLAIAGYGTGKSHFALTIANLVTDPQSETAEHILSAIDAADEGIGANVRHLVQESSQPCLAVALNGMQGFDLASEITRQITGILKKSGHDTTLLDDLRPRFGQAVNLIRLSNESVLAELLAATEVSSGEALIQELEKHDEPTYVKVHDFFAARGMPIRVLATESVKEVIDIAVREYCGPGKPYRSLLILFDEFGKYTEFATVKSQIAGNGALQDLFEAIQANTDNACLVGFIQFELNAYVQRVAPEYKNEILRYVTRYQSANKLYLSINLETLMANLLEKLQPELLAERFDNDQATAETREIMAKLGRWFPASQNFGLWRDEMLFHSVIRKGCWPLAPTSTWLLFFLAAAGKHLQERSALALLGNAFERFGEAKVSDVTDWTVAPAGLWSEVLFQELIGSEESGQQGSITHAYASVMGKHGSRLTLEQVKLLQAVVLASKLGLVVGEKNEAIDALGELSGLPRDIAETNTGLLQEELNVIEWDEAFKAFDILGDAVPRTQFLAFINQRIASSYDQSGKSKLFASHAAEWCDLLGDLECDFAEEKKISTSEWRYSAITTNLEFVEQQIKFATGRWASAVDVDEARGTIIYAYVGPSSSAEEVAQKVRSQLRAAFSENGLGIAPVLVVLMHDTDGLLGKSLAEYAVLEDITESDKAKFGNLIGAHKEKLNKTIRDQVDEQIKSRLYVTGLREDFEAVRLSRIGTELFSKIYKSPIPFPFDGFTTARGNASETCHELTRELLHGKLDFDSVATKQVKAKNRAITVLKDTWEIFKKTGEVTRRPAQPVIRALTAKWDDSLAKEQKLSVSDMIWQLCRPPYGANIASAGLLLGVFVAARYEDLVVMKEGQQLGISQWIEDGVFRGKFLNLTVLEGADLMQLGEGSSEWETLLDEWEQCTDYLARINCLERAHELRCRAPVPPALVYREERLGEQGLEAIAALKKLERAENEAIEKIENGFERHDVALLSWGTADLKKLCDSMTEARPLWTDSQIAAIKPRYEKGRQAVIHFFPEWLTTQSPRSALPGEVGDFKHKMINKIGANLEALGLQTEFEKLEERTLNIARNADSIAEANQLVRDIASWLQSAQEAIKIGRIADIRALKQSGSEYSAKLRGLAQRTQLEKVLEAQAKVAELVHKLKQAEDVLMKRTSRLWNTKIHADTDVDNVLTEVDSLVHAFDNLPNDLEDLQIMRQALRTYKNYYYRLSDDRETWAGFDGIAQDMRKECAELIGEGAVPWPPDEVIAAFVADTSRMREKRSLEWITDLQAEASGVASMSATEANSLHTRLTNPPGFFAEVHKKPYDKLVHQVNQRLGELNIEWLVEKFKELSDESRKEFLKIAEGILGQAIS